MVYFLGMKAESDIPENIGAPARRALQNQRIDSLAKLSKKTEMQIADLHGMGPKGILILKKALRKKKLTFKK